MTNSFCTKHDGIVQILNAAVMRFAAVEEGWHSSRALVCDHYCFLGTQDLFSELAKFWGEIFLIDHIKTSDEFDEAFVITGGAFSDMLDHLFYVTFAYNFEASKHKPEIKVWRSLL